MGLAAVIQILSYLTPRSLIFFSRVFRSKIICLRCFQNSIPRMASYSQTSLDLFAIISLRDVNVLFLCFFSRCRIYSDFIKIQMNDQVDRLNLIQQFIYQMAEGQAQYKDIRTQMLEALAKYNIKQVDVAREAGINHSTLSLWLQGSVKGNYINIEGDLADWLECLYSGRPRYTALNKAINKQFNLVPNALNIRRKRTLQMQEDLIPIHLELEPDGKKYKQMFCWNANEPYFTPEQYVKLLVAENTLLVPFETQIVDTIKKAISHHRTLRPKQQQCLRILELDIKVDNICLKDRFEWDINDPNNSPQDFACSLAQELNLNGEFVVKIAHQIREQLEYYRKNYHHEMTQKTEQNQLMDMKKSTRNLISLSGVYANSSNEKIMEDNYLRYGQDQEWEPKIEILDAGQVRKFQKFQQRKNRYARRIR